MAHLNEHGVLTGGRKIVLARGKRFLVVATLCEFHGQWYFGVNVKVGRTEVDSFGFGFLPAPKRDKPYPTFDEALNAARLYAERVIRDRTRRKHTPINPPVKAAARKALEALYRERQLKLFG
ncbi:hypothetical protein GF1_16160 [Desulfolithobacter dissulfuricans]|uniref:Uncharacterized protein n=1 Tax=Desulfolithobacter dissulfuricans TaxID=2795293 RepID=A0A915U1T4_9BACT|nr:hypothetical protein [Desulfolithobacter dissulfuricans]BCO09240.1 hypothetical protein GF1_16160 [Desulfolithobacter dissulfuricans]